MSRTSADVVVERQYVPDREAMLRALTSLLVAPTATPDIRTEVIQPRRRSVPASGPAPTAAAD